jgi:hypothetical protein
VKPSSFLPKFAAPFLILLFVGLLASVHLQYRTITGDEVPYTDPAIRLVSGQGWTSIAWAPSSEEFFVGNFPAYPLLLAAVFHLAEPNLSSARLLSHLLFAVAFMLLLAAGRRWAWFPDWKWECTWLATCLFGLYVFPVAQYARPDAWALFLLCSATWLASLSQGKLRTTGLFLIGFLSGASGLQLIPVLGILAVVHLRLTRDWRPSTTLAIGGAVGLGATLATVAGLGYLQPFLDSTFGMGADRWAQWQGWRDPLLWSSSLVLILSLGWGQLNIPIRSRAICGLLAGLGTATLLFALSKFPNYYAYFAAIPASIAAFSVLPHCSRRMLRPFGLAALCGSALLGFPLVSIMVWNSWEQRNLSHLEAWIEAQITPEVKVVATPLAYFAARRAGAEIRTDFMCRQTDSVADAQLLLLMKNDPWIRHWKYAHQWRIVGEYDAPAQYPPRISPLNLLNRLSYSPQYQLELWRKAPTSH